MSIPDGEASQSRDRRATIQIEDLPRVSPDDRAMELGDFTTTARVIFITAVAIGLGVVSAGVAWFLLKLIGFFTNLFFFGRISVSMADPADSHLGLAIVAVPVVGALIVGLIARFGSERIRGHGIPEAIEAILINGSKVEPRVAFFKPISSAISIGSGGPFGAEGPIIMTGGAVGSLVAQFLRLTSAERKTLLVAGAAAGMAATFAAPVASVLLAVELLLFEWKPRSLIPVALASATAAVARRYIIGIGPIFPTPPHPEFIGISGILGCVAIGVLAGFISLALTAAVYFFEDAFHKLPIHWMWWPAIGGVVVGIGGLIFPEALGVGYGTIGRLLQGDHASSLILGILLVKSTIWAVSLGSGTSGGVLAPLLMIGGAAGGLAAYVLPDRGPGFWPLIAMGAIMGGTMRSPFTGVVFALELTHDINPLLPLLIAVTIAHGVTVLVLKRSILTEKISRRGYHVSREYSIDPLEILFVREVMRSNVDVLSMSVSLSELRELRDLRLSDDTHLGQRLYPIVDDFGTLVGVVPSNRVQSADGDCHSVTDLLLPNPVVAYPDEPLRLVVYRMAETGLTRFPVVERETRRVVGMISLNDLLKARVRNLEAERRRERILPVRLTNPLTARRNNVISN
ncbi:MAG TPA: chloride channel protein [Thermomicrobiales bacterium]|jgi:H+/Cl- antiporter ClcA|nr:chloride channel protein [Thermomicrobiales bacterium]